MEFQGQRKYRGCVKDFVKNILSQRIWRSENYRKHKGAHKLREKESVTLDSNQIGRRRKGEVKARVGKRLYN